MNINEYIESIEAWREAVLTLEDPRVGKAARIVAYYAAMIDAAMDDPLDDEDEQAEVMRYMTQRYTEELEAYEEIINELL